MIEVKGKNGIYANVIADSYSEHNDKRLTTLEVCYHRYILAEVDTHRALSKNSASSRAIPFNSIKDTLLSNPAIPVYWGKNKRGMSADEELSELEKKSAYGLWLHAMKDAIAHATVLSEIGLHKQVTNRLIENFGMTKTVISGTDWNNLFYQRCDPGAQPEFQELANCMREAMNLSTPDKLYEEEWHLPYINKKRHDNGHLSYLDNDHQELQLYDAVRISASCCAQVSYRKLDDTKENAMSIYYKLFSGPKPHLSPTEHQGTPIRRKNYDGDVDEWDAGVTHMKRNGDLCSGNYNGWIQFRNLLDNNVCEG